MADEKVQKAVFKWEVDNASLNKVIKSFDQVINRGDDLRGTIFDARIEGERYAESMKKSFRTSSSAIDENTKAISNLRDEYIAASSAAKNFAQTATSGGGFTAGRLDSLLTGGGRALSGLGFGDLGNATQTVGDFFQLIDTGQQVFATASASVSGGFAAIAAAAAPLVVVLGPIAVGLLALYGEVQEGQSIIKDGQAGVEAYYTAIATGNEKVIKEQIGDLETQRKIQEEIRDANQGAIDNFYEGSRNATGALETATYAFVDLTGGINPLKDKVSQSQKEIDRLTILINAMNEALGVTSASTEVIKNSFIGEIPAALSAGQTAVSDFIEFMLKKEKERQATSKFTFEVMRQQQQKELAEQEAANKKKADAEKKLVDDSIAILKRRDDAIKALMERESQIVQQKIEANEAAYQRLLENQAKLVQDAERDDAADQRKADFEELKQQIENNRAEQKALVDHQKRLRDIQRSFASQERDALLDRNFLQLFKLQENKKEQLAEEEEANQEAAAERQQAIRDQQQDTSRQRIFERNERRIALNNALMDARAGYIKELEMQQQAATRSLAMLSAEIEAKRQGAIAELQLVNMTEEEKHKIFLKYLYEYQRLLGQPFTPYQNPNVEGTAGGTIYQSSRKTGVTLRQFADGGFPTGPFSYNERAGQRETFGGVMLPGGMGVAFPFKSGYVDPGKSGGFTLMQNITVQGTNNPELTAKAVVRISREQAWQVQKDVAN